MPLCEPCEAKNARRRTTCWFVSGIYIAASRERVDIRLHLSSENVHARLLVSMTWVAALPPILMYFWRQDR